MSKNINFHAFLVYDRPRLARNGWFVETLTEKFARRGWNLTLKIAEELESVKLEEPFPDAVLMRCTFPELSRKWEEAGVRVFNSATVSAVTNDKLRTAEFFAVHDLPMMKTVLLTRTDDNRDSGKFSVPFPFPVVMKSRTGHGGTEVFCVKSESKITEILKQTVTPPEYWILQPLASQPGRDVRVYIVGNQPVAAMERISETDFRSNYSLGGSARPYTLRPAEKTLISKILEILPLDFAGIDLIFHDGHPILNEIEDVVGSRMLYAHTEIDILDVFLDY
ncbi:MAG: hypothetical protein Q4C70_04225, partial [Planctomycetia bacterium]|nr:hypothetical protein [Planctomycetia bacterium]